MKTGDKIVCISNILSHGLKLYNTYVISDIVCDNYGIITYMRIDGEFFRYYPHRFITLNEYRKQKLINLNYV